MMALTELYKPLQDIFQVVRDTGKTQQNEVRNETTMGSPYVEDDGESLYRQVSCPCDVIVLTVVVTKSWRDRK